MNRTITIEQKAKFYIVNNNRVTDGIISEFNKHKTSINTLYKSSKPKCNSSLTYVTLVNRNLRNGVTSGIPLNSTGDNKLNYNVINIESIKGIIRR